MVFTVSWNSGMVERFDNMDAVESSLENTPYYTVSFPSGSISIYEDDGEDFPVHTPDGGVGIVIEE